MKRGIAALFTAIALLVSGLSIAAHHSFAAQYDRDKPITLKGGITRIEWANPHIYFYIDVADAGGAKAHWAIEGGAPSTLYRAGWRKDSAKVGDVVTVEASSPAMDRSWSTCRPRCSPTAATCLSEPDLLPEGPMMPATAARSRLFAPPRRSAPC